MSYTKIEPLIIQDAFLIRGKKFYDDRGYFEEVFNENKFEKPITDSWKQVSLSESKKDVLRGLHCSNYAKFVQCIKGEVYDVIVDLRPDSPTFMKWQGVWLNADAEEPVHVFVPKRCGHGFFAKTDCLFLYLQDGTYNQAQDIELNLFDKTINIDWPKASNTYVISKKDSENKFFDEIKKTLFSSYLERKLTNSLFIKENLSFGLSKQCNFLVYGGNGFLGKCFVEMLIKNKITFSIGLARLENRQDLLNEIKTLVPKQIICLAGISGKPNISWCESNQIETIRTNVIGQLNLADISNEFNIHCTLLTSGVIYQYDENHKINSNVGFKEEDEPNFSENFYCKMRIIEEKLLASYKNVLNLRITYPMTSDLNPKSFLGKLISYPKIQSIPVSVTVIDDLWPIMLDLSEKQITGTFNFNNPETISHDEILKLYKSILDKNHNWTLSEPSKQSAAAELNVDKLLKLGYKIPKISDAVQTLLLKIKTRKETELRLVEIGDKFQPKNILLTGGAGFIGSHVAIHLVKTYKNYNVIVLDILDYCASIKNLDDIKDAPNFKFVKADITNFRMVKYIMEIYNVDCVMHFAAQSHVDFSMLNSIKFTEVNVKGTHVLLECARLCNIKRFIHVSTDEVYGTTDVNSDINQALDPTNPYACSKLAAECIIMSYQKMFKMPIIISRGNNSYGPHQFVEKVIPKFIMRLLRNQKCCVHGDGSSERDFLYISDVVDAFDLLLHYGKPNKFYNIGATSGINISDLAKSLVRQIKNVKEGEESSYIEQVNDRVLDDKRYRIDSTSLKLLGWEQKINLEEGLRRTIKWYKENQNHWDNFEYALMPHPIEKDYI